MCRFPLYHNICVFKYLETFFYNTTMGSMYIINIIFSEHLNRHGIDYSQVLCNLK